jgi:hypothetical protein
VTRRRLKLVTDDVEQLPAWVRCESCEDFYCTIHELHAFECDCPPLEVWLEAGQDPYEDVPAKAYAGPPWEAD